MHTRDSADVKSCCCAYTMFACMYACSSRYRAMYSFLYTDTSEARVRPTHQRIHTHTHTCTDTQWELWMCAAVPFASTRNERTHIYLTHSLAYDQSVSLFSWFSSLILFNDFFSADLLILETVTKFDTFTWRPLFSQPNISNLVHDNLTQFFKIFFFVFKWIYKCFWTNWEHHFFTEIICNETESETQSHGRRKKKKLVMCVTVAAAATKLIGYSGMWSL